MNDRPPDLEERLRTALNARSETVEPASDSYLSLQRRLTAATEHRGRRSIPPRYFAAAAVLVVAVATAAVLVNQQRRSNVEAVGTTTTTPTTTIEPTTTTVVDEPEAVLSVTSVPVREYVPAPVAGPREVSPEAAAVAFLELLGVSHAGLEIDGLDVGVRTFTEAGEVGDVIVRLQLIEAELRKGAPGYSVISATAESIAITSPAVGSENTRSPLVVAGRGRSSGGSLNVSFVSSSDGLVLASTVSSAGATGEPEPFTAELVVRGAERGWVVVAENGPGVGVVDGVVPFSAIPISFVVGIDPVEYAVAGLPADDPDGGLVVRDLPGIDEGRVIVVLPAGTAGIRRLGRVPARIGDEVWWEIEVEFEGHLQRGWVNRRYLVDPTAPVPSEDSRDPVADEALAETAKRFLLAGFDRDAESLRQLPWADQIDIGWIRAPRTVDRAELTSIAFWTDAHDWAMPAEVGEPIITLSTLSLLELPAPTDPDVAFELDADPVSPYGLDVEALVGRYPDARTITIFDQAADTPWHHTTLVMADRGDGPEILAVLLTVWVP